MQSTARFIVAAPVILFVLLALVAIPVPARAADKVILGVNPNYLTTPSGTVTPGFNIFGFTFALPWSNTPTQATAVPTHAGKPVLSGAEPCGVLDFSCQSRNQSKGFDPFGIVVDNPGKLSAAGLAPAPAPAPAPAAPVARERERTGAPQREPAGSATAAPTGGTSATANIPESAAATAGVSGDAVVASEETRELFMARCQDNQIECSRKWTYEVSNQQGATPAEKGRERTGAPPRESAGSATAAPQAGGMSLRQDLTEDQTTPWYLRPAPASASNPVAASPDSTSDTPVDGGIYYNGKFVGWRPAGERELPPTNMLGTDNWWNKYVLRVPEDAIKRAEAISSASNRGSSRNILTPRDSITTTPAPRDDGLNSDNGEGGLMKARYTQEQGLYPGLRGEQTRSVNIGNGAGVSEISPSGGMTPEQLCFRGYDNFESFCDASEFGSAGGGADIGQSAWGSAGESGQDYLQANETDAAGNDTFYLGDSGVIQQQDSLWLSGPSEFESWVMPSEGTTINWWETPANQTTDFGITLPADTGVDTGGSGGWIQEISNWWSEASNKPTREFSDAAPASDLLAGQPLIASAFGAFLVPKK